MEFKSSKFVVIKSFIITIFASAMVGVLVYMFTTNELYALIGIGVVILLSILMSISEWKFRLVLSEDKLEVFSGKKLKKAIDLTNASYYSRTKQGGNNIGVDCSLEITNDEESYTVDCTPLGGRQYHRLLEALGFDDAPQVLETTTKGDN